MKSMNRVVLSFSALVLISSLAYGETADHSAADKSRKEDKTAASSRPSSDGLLRENELKLLEESFKMNKDLIQKNFGKGVHDGLTEVKDKKEATISKELAKLFGTRDKDHMDAMYKLLKGEDGNGGIFAKRKNEEKDERYDALMKRLAWAIEEIRGEKNTNPAAEEFKKLFREDFKKKTEENEKLLALVEDAVKPGATGEAAKKKLRDEVNRDSVLAFIDEFSKGTPKQKELAGKIADAISWKDDKGNKFIDVMAAGEKGDPARIYFGSAATPEKISQAMQKVLASANGGSGSHNFSLSPAVHTTPPTIKEWFIDDKGEFQKGAPPGVTPYKPVAAPAVAQQPAGAPQGGQQGGGGAASAGDAQKIQLIKTALTRAGCMGCHGGNPSFTGDTLATLKLNAGKKTGVTGGRMQTGLGKADMAGLNAGLSAQEREAIAAWAAASP